MTREEYLLWLRSQRRRPGLVREVPAKDITTVIKEYEGDTPNTKTTTIKGGLLGDPAQDWDGSAAFAEQDIGMGGGGPFIGLGDPRNVRAGPDLPPAYAPNPAYAPPGSSPSMRAVYPPIPNQVPTPSNVHRRQGAGDRRVEGFVPPNVNTMPPGINYPPQASGALPPPAAPDPRFQPFLPGQDMRMDDPNWSRATAVNTPQPTNLPGTDFFGGDVLAPPPPRQSMGMVDPTWSPQVPGSNVPPISPRVAERRRQYADQELQRMTPPLEREVIDPTGSGSSIADARIQAIADSQRIESEQAYQEEWAKKRRLAESEVPVGHGQDDPADFEGWDPEDLDRYIEARKKRLQGLKSPHPSMAIDPKDMAGYHGGRPGTPEWAKGLADVLGIALPVDLISGGLNKILGMLGAPQEALEDPVLGRQWILRNAEKVGALLKKGATDQPPIRDAWLDKVDEWRERVANRKAINEDIMDAEEMARAGMPDPLPPKKPELGEYPRHVSGRLPPEKKAVDVPKTDADKKAVDKRVAVADTTKIASATENKNELRDNPKLAALWGKYAYDPAARKKVYLDNLKQVYKKALMLDIIAQLTGGKSRSKEYLKMATTKLDAVDQFDQEQRVSNIWKQVFTGTNGQFYMPKNKREAAERAHFFGGDPTTVKNIFGSVPEKTCKVQYYRQDPKDPTKWQHQRFTEDPGPSWIAGQARSETPGGDKLLADRKMERYNQLLYKYQDATGEDKEAALRNLENWASFAKLNTGGVTEQQNRTFAEKLWKTYFTDEQGKLLPNMPTFLEYFHGAGRFKLPELYGGSEGRTVRGYGAGGGGETPSGSERSYASEADFTARAELEGVKSGDWVIVAGNRRKVK